MLVLQRLACTFWLLSVGLAGAEARADELIRQLGNADRAAIQQVIKGQLDAFRRDDDSAAFGMAAPSIRTMFGNPENFMTMVKNGFQPLYRLKEFSFDALLEEDGRTLQRMRVVGADGVAHMALYTMERQADGRWLIAGCVLLDLHEQSV